MHWFTPEDEHQTPSPVAQEVLQTAADALPLRWNRSLAQIPERLTSGALRYLYQCIQCLGVFVDAPDDRMLSSERLRGAEQLVTLQHFGSPELIDLPRKRCPFCAIQEGASFRLEEYTLWDGSGRLGYRFTWQSMYHTEKPSRMLMVVQRPGASALSYRQPVTDAGQTTQMLAWLTQLQMAQLAVIHAPAEAELLQYGFPLAHLDLPGKATSWQWHAVVATGTCPLWQNEIVHVALGAVREAIAPLVNMEFLFAATNIVAGRCFEHFKQLMADIVAQEAKQP